MQELIRVFYASSVKTDAKTSECFRRVLLKPYASIYKSTSQYKHFVMNVCYQLLRSMRPLYDITSFTLILLKHTTKHLGTVE